MKSPIWILVFPFLLIAAPSEFEIDKDLVNRIYEQTLEEAGGGPSTVMANMVVTPQLSLMSPTEMTLSNSYFDVPYSHTGTIPVFRVSIGTEIIRLADFSLLAQGSAGYGFREGNNIVQAKTAGKIKEYTDVIRLQYVPLALGGNLQYHIPHFPWLVPGFMAQVGVQWFYQVGKLDGLEQGFWMPTYSYGPSLTLFGSPDAWFSGVVASLTSSSNFNNTNHVRLWSFDVGITFAL